MKKYVLGFIFIALSFVQVLEAQQNTSQAKRPVVAVLNIDMQGLYGSHVQAGNVVRRELEKIDTFEVMDKYDVMYLIKKDSFDINGCYGKLCLTEVANILKADKMLTGSIENFSETMTVTLRLIDIKTQTIEKTLIREFISIPAQVGLMLQVSVREFFGRSNDPELLTKLTKKYDYANAVNTPNVDILRLNGPRMGFTVFTGETWKILQQKEYNGGYDSNFPAMFQFGYQFEKQYINDGNFQALFEFIPMITGVEQGLFIPSLTILNGFRSNKNGWEFAFGPTVSAAKIADGYYVDDEWFLESDTHNFDPDIHRIESRLDSRGDHEIYPGFVFALGKSFKSGRLNVPFNAYVIPNRDGVRFGLSFGFNTK